MWVEFVISFRLVRFKKLYNFVLCIYVNLVYILVVIKGLIEWVRLKILFDL